MGDGSSWLQAIVDGRREDAWQTEQVMRVRGNGNKMGVAMVEKQVG